jgi:CPA2 family monovalent cation:H+ antiporter-2
MHHETPLIGTVVVGLVVAFLLGALAHRLKISPIAGYLLAGVAVGPFTPGFVADRELALELAEIGVILLMFGVGLHFSLRDLLAVRRIAVPGAVVQIAAATLMGMALSHVLGWGMLAGFFFGLSLSVASTVVLLRALQTHKLIETERGRIATGWLIVEDLVMVLALVLLPTIADIAVNGNGNDSASIETLIRALLLTAGKVVGFIAFILIIGRRVIPAALHWVAHTGSRELFRLAVLAIALGVAFGAAKLFSVSFALGAFFAGMILGETRLSQRAAEETLPLRDAFAVLFFVSVGMLFNPTTLIEQPWSVLATVLIIVVGKSVAAYAIVRLFGHPNRTALTVAASLAQIGEFSFILAGLGVALGVMPSDGRDLILAGAILSILIHPVLVSLIERQRPAAEGLATLPAAPERDEARKSRIVLIGYGRVGKLVGAELKARKRPFTVIEERSELADSAREEGAEVFVGNAVEDKILQSAGLEAASKLLVAIPEGYDAGQIVQKARAMHPDLTIIARAHSDEEVAHLKRLGAHTIIMGEREIASRMLTYVNAS